jgi:hypothetical protein
MLHQVLFKRKPVRIPPLAKDPEDDAMVCRGRRDIFYELHARPPTPIPTHRQSTMLTLPFQVWQINETGEVFTTYDDYLER